MAKKQDSKASETTGDFGIPADTYGLKDNPTSVSSSFEKSKSENDEKSHGDNYGIKGGSSNNGRENPSAEQNKDLPHSKKVRGTLANSSGGKVNKTMLGDPVSLKSETSETDVERETESGVGRGKSKL